MQVRRTLPHRTLRTIGAFCFVDHYGPSPTSGDEEHPMVVPPHPHTGLADRVVAAVGDRRPPRQRGIVSSGSTRVS